MSEVMSGLQGIVVSETKLSRVDGQAGRLTIGGYSVEHLAPRATFEEALFLLWHDRLPDPSELRALCHDLKRRREIAPEALACVTSAARQGAHPMDALRMGAAALSLSEVAEVGDTREDNVERALRAVASFPTVVAAYWRARLGNQPIAPDPTLGHAANYLRMLSGATPSLASVRALETYLNTVIDHGMNASTFAARVIASTRSDMLSAVVGAIGALKGPLHGGAPGPALDMVFEIRRASVASGRDVASEARAWAMRAVAQGERIMGFGHRVYQVRDPRADVLNEAAAKLFAEGADKALHEDARLVEQEILAALEKSKPGRRIQTNVEFYTALVLHGLGLETELFSPTFAIGRVGGWTAHVLEQIDEDRLIRPRAAYTGEENRAWQAA